MFGYIRPRKPELLVREYQQYRGVYCAICRQLGEGYGIAARMTLSYDSTFLAIVLLGLTESCPGFEEGRCVVNPLKKCTFCRDGGEPIRFSSALSVLLAYQKVRDDIADDRPLRRLRAYSVLPFTAAARKRAARDYPELDQAVSVAMLEQAAVEQTGGESIDYYAEPTAKMLQEVFSMAVHAPELSTQDRVARQIGYYLGRWVYIIDAADDVERDLREKAFNPFIIRYSLKEDAPPEQILEVHENANRILNATLAQLIAAVNVMDFFHFGGLIHNVVEQGLPDMQREVLFEKEKKKRGSL